MLIDILQTTVKITTYIMFPYNFVSMRISADVTLKIDVITLLDIRRIEIAAQVKFWYWHICIINLLNYVCPLKEVNLQ